MDGIADGCVLLHEPANGGLAPAAAALDSLFVAWRQRLPLLSRADFWQVREFGDTQYSRVCAETATERMGGWGGGFGRGKTPVQRWDCGQLTVTLSARAAVSGAGGGARRAVRQPAESDGRHMDAASALGAS